LALRYGKSPETVLHNHDIGFVAKAVYAELALCRNGRTLQCNPSHQVLRAHLRISERTLAYAIRQLEKAGEVVRKYEPGKLTRYTLPGLESEQPETAPDPCTHMQDSPAPGCRTEAGTPAPACRTPCTQMQDPPASTCRTSHLVDARRKTTEQTREQTTEELELEACASSGPGSEHTVEQSVDEPSRRNGHHRPLRAAYKPTPEAENLLATWRDRAPLPQTCNRTTCLKTLDDLHRLDGLSWDRIARTCDWALKEWVPQGYLSSPVALRTLTRKKDMKTWEAIERQVQAREARFMRPGDPADRPRRAAVWKPRQQKYVCCDPAGKPWTGKTRMLFMERYYPDATKDPDQGHDFTIPNQQMPANRRKADS
jgi:hypothetical protein